MGLSTRPQPPQRNSPARLPCEFSEEHMQCPDTWRLQDQASGLMPGIQGRNLRMMQRPDMFRHAAGVESHSSQLAASRSELDSPPVFPEAQTKFRSLWKPKLTSSCLKSWPCKPGVRNITTRTWLPTTSVLRFCLRSMTDETQACEV